jgi:hypothetical protein
MANAMLVASSTVAAIKMILAMLLFIVVPPRIDFTGFLTGAGQLVNTGGRKCRTILYSSLQRNVIHEEEIILMTGDQQ